jgi:hypothetical protein
MSMVSSAISTGRTSRWQELSELPAQLGELLTEAGLRDVGRWWQELDFFSRRQVFQLWADCVAMNEGQRIIACVEGEFVEADEIPENGVWHNDFYEYLVNHEEFFVQERKFHVCTRHPLARAAIEAGRIPRGFTCGLEENACPMKRILMAAPGKSVRLKLGFYAAERAGIHG